MRFAAILGALALIASGCAAPQNHAEDLITPPPGKATILISVSRAMQDSTFGLTPVTPGGKKFDHDLLRPFATFDLGHPTDRGFIWLQVEPGQYLITWFRHQNNWGLSFGPSTEAFRVEAGQKLYLGNLDPLPLEILLRRNVSADHAERVLQGDVRMYDVELPAAWRDASAFVVPLDQPFMVSSSMSVSGVAPAIFKHARF